MVQIYVVPKGTDYFILQILSVCYQSFLYQFYM